MVDIKNTVIVCSCNIDEAHGTGLSHFIFLMRFSCAEKNEDGKRGGTEGKGDSASRRLLTAEEDRPHPLVGRLQRKRGEAEGRRLGWEGKHQGGVSISLFVFSRKWKRINEQGNGNKQKKGIPERENRTMPLSMIYCGFKSLVAQAG